MNEFEKTIGNALADNVNEQYGEFFDVERKHRFSWSYRRARRKNILSAEKTRRGRPIPAMSPLSSSFSIPIMKGVPLKKRVAVLSIAMIMSVGLGTGVGASISAGLKRDSVTQEDFRLKSVSMEGAKRFIEYEYYIPEIPEGYYLEQYYGNELGIKFLHTSYDGNQQIDFIQSTKHTAMYFDNENWDSIEDVMVGDKYGKLIISGRVVDLVWDNGDYILEIFCTVPAEEAIRLAESVQRRDTFSEGFEYINPSNAKPSA